MSELEQLIGIPITDYYASTSLGRIHYVVGGNTDGPTLVFFHGANMGIGQWYPNLSYFSKTFRIVAIDMWNAGESASITREQNIPENYAKGSGEIFQQIVRGPTVFIGHSFGAWIAYHLARKHANTIHGLVLSSPVGLANRIPLTQQLFRSNILALLLLATILRSTEANVKKFIADGFSKGFQPSASFLLQVLGGYAKDPEKRNPYVFAHMVTAHLSELNFEDELINMSFPTLILRGEHDPMTDKEGLGRIVAGQEKIVLRTIAGAAHVPNIEKANEFNTLIDKFLQMHLHTR